MNDPDDLDWTEVTRARDARRRTGDDQPAAEDATKAEAETDQGPSRAPERDPRRAASTRRAPGPRQRGLPPARRPDQVKSAAERAVERERRLKRRAYPLAVLALAAFTFGAIKGSGSPSEDLARDFVARWTSQDFAGMYADLSPEAQKQYSATAFTEAYQSAQNASTAEAIDPGSAKEISGGASIGVGVKTRLFGSVDGTITLPMTNDKIDWTPNMVFPGLRPGESLGRKLKLGNRASLLARDGTPLAQGQGGSRTSPLGSSAIDVAGELGTPDPEQRAEVEKEGYPVDAPTGVSGLERAFNQTLAGEPSGQLVAVQGALSDPDIPDSTQGRVLASGDGAPGQRVKTTIDPAIQRVTVSALGGQSGGIAVLDARNGNVLALAGQAFSNPQPPGSTFKVVTATAALEHHKAKVTDTYPVLSEINAGGRVLANAHHEFCGGTFVQAFAKSCNTVFAPLGVEVGEQNLVATAEAYGFNEAPTLYNPALTELIQPGHGSIPEDPGTDVDLAATSIGQGRVLATPLGMASIAQTIASHGKRSPTSIVISPASLRPTAKAVSATSPEIARVMTGLMRSVVTQGTGVRANLSGIQVAGKTGTAELGPKPNQPPGTPADQLEQIVDGWFIAFAPANKPKIAIAVMLIDASGDGGETAAPIAASIIQSILG